MVLNKECSVVKDGIKSYLVNKNTFIKLGILYDVIKQFNSNKFYYSIKKKLNIRNKIFKDINYKISTYYTHDIMTYQQGINLSKRIISRLHDYDTFYYNERYHLKENCLLYKYYLIIELFSNRLYSNISFTTHVKLATYLFNLNYNNHEFNDYINCLTNDNLDFILEYHKYL